MILLLLMFFLSGCNKFSFKIKHKIGREIISSGGFSESLFDGFDPIQDLVYNKLKKIKDNLDLSKWEDEKNDLLSINVQIKYNFFHFLAMLEDDNKFDEIFYYIFRDDRLITQDIASQLTFAGSNLLQTALLYNIKSSLDIWNKSTEEAKIEYDKEDMGGENIIFYIGFSYLKLYSKENKEKYNKIYLELIKNIKEFGYDLNHVNKKGQNVLEALEKRIQKSQHYEEDLEEIEAFNEFKKLISDYIDLEVKKIKDINIDNSKVKMSIV